MSGSTTLPFTGGTIVVAGHAVGMNYVALVAVLVIVAGALLVRRSFRRNKTIQDV